MLKILNIQFWLYNQIWLNFPRSIITLTTSQNCHKQKKKKTWMRWFSKLQLVVKFEKSPKRICEPHTRDEFHKNMNKLYTNSRDEFHKDMNELYTNSRDEFHKDINELYTNSRDEFHKDINELCYNGHIKNVIYKLKR